MDKLPSREYFTFTSSSNAILAQGWLREIEIRIDYATGPKNDENDKQFASLFNSFSSESALSIAIKFGTGAARTRGIMSIRRRRAIIINDHEETNVRTSRLWCNDN